jgi:hypothetical protein
MLNNILFESRKVSVVNRSQIRMVFFCEEVVKLNGVMHSREETATKGEKEGEIERKRKEKKPPETDQNAFRFDA